MRQPLFAICAPLLIAGCATSPIVDAGPPLPEGSPAALGRPVNAAGLALTPMRVIEDSRCPANARCVQAGRIVVETRVDGPGWRESLPMTLGEPAGVRGYILNLVSAEPGQMAGGPAIDPVDYRFAYEGWPPGRVPE